MRGYEPETRPAGRGDSAAVTVVTVDAMHAWTVTPVRSPAPTRTATTLDVHRFVVEQGADGARPRDLRVGRRPRLLAVEPARPRARPPGAADPAALAAVDLVVDGSID